MSSTASWVIAFVIAQILLIALANLPLPYWQSSRQ